MQSKICAKAERKGHLRNHAKEEVLFHDGTEVSERLWIAACGVLPGDDSPQRLKPRSLQKNYVRPEGRTLQQA
jgi:hypothetical protein